MGLGDKLKNGIAFGTAFFSTLFSACAINAPGYFPRLTPDEERIMLNYESVLLQEYLKYHENLNQFLDSSKIKIKLIGIYPEDSFDLKYKVICQESFEPEQFWRVYKDSSKKPCRID